MDTLYRNKETIKAVRVPNSLMDFQKAYEYLCAKEGCAVSAAEYDIRVLEGDGMLTTTRVCGRLYWPGRSSLFGRDATGFMTGEWIVEDDEGDIRVYRDDLFQERYGPVAEGEE